MIVEDEDEDEKDDKGCWLSSVSNIPAFDFLAEEGENIWYLLDGELFNDYKFSGTAPFFMHWLRNLTS